MNRFASLNISQFVGFCSCCFFFVLWHRCVFSFHEVNDMEYESRLDAQHFDYACLKFHTKTTQVRESENDSQIVVHHVRSIPERHQHHPPTPPKSDIGWSYESHLTMKQNNDEKGTKKSVAMWDTANGTKQTQLNGFDAWTLQNTFCIDTNSDCTSSILLCTLSCHWIIVVRAFKREKISLINLRSSMDVKRNCLENVPKSKWKFNPHSEYQWLNSH